jgi:hypothetical protein
MSALGSESMNYVHPLEVRGQQLPSLMAARNSFYLSLTRTSGYSLGNFTQRNIMPLFLEKHEFYSYSHEGYMSTLTGLFKSNIGIMPILLEHQNLFQRIKLNITRKIVVLNYWNHINPTPVNVYLLPGVVSELKNFWTGKRRTISEYEMSVIKCKELTKVVDTNVNVELLTNNLAPYIAIYDHIDPFSLNNITDNEKEQIKRELRFWGRVFRHLGFIWFLYFVSMLLSYHFTGTPHYMALGIIIQLILYLFDVIV